MCLCINGQCFYLEKGSWKCNWFWDAASFAITISSMFLCIVVITILLRYSKLPWRDGPISSGKLRGWMGTGVEVRKAPHEGIGVYGFLSPVLQVSEVDLVGCCYRLKSKEGRCRPEAGMCPRVRLSGRSGIRHLVIGRSRLTREIPTKSTINLPRHESRPIVWRRTIQIIYLLLDFHNVCGKNNFCFLEQIYNTCQKMTIGQKENPFHVGTIHLPKKVEQKCTSSFNQ